MLFITMISCIFTFFSDYLYYFHELQCSHSYVYTFTHGRVKFLVVSLFPPILSPISPKSFLSSASPNQAGPLKPEVEVKRTMQTLWPSLSCSTILNDLADYQPTTPFLGEVGMNNQYGTGFLVSQGVQSIWTSRITNCSEIGNLNISTWFLRSSLRKEMQVGISTIVNQFIDFIQPSIP